MPCKSGQRWILTLERSFFWMPREKKICCTQHNKIFVASPRNIDLAQFYEQLQALEAAAAHNDEGVVKQLAAMIPTFTPTRENLKL